MMIYPILTFLLIQKCRSQWQSAWNGGEDYASSLTHNQTSNSYILTGTSYNNSNGISHCVVSSVDLAENTIEYVQKFVGDDILTSCSSSSIHGAGGLIVTGFMERSHVISSMKDDFSVIDSSIESYGHVRTMNGFFLNLNGETGLGTNGKILTENEVTYPLLSVDDSTNGGIIVASLISTDASLNRNYEYEEELPTGRMSHPNPIELKYGEGSGMSIAIQYFDYVRSTGTFRGGWVRVLGTVDEKDVRIHDMALFQNKVFIVGATTGHGDPFGDKDYSGSSDLDGFITVVLSEDGSLVNSRRVATEGDREDILNAICVGEDGVYAAGSTTGFMDPALKRSARFNRFSAFLMKLDGDLNTVWVKQVFTPSSKVYAPQDVLGMGCAVAPDGVYLTGVVDNNGNIEQEGVGNGLDDIFIAKFDFDGSEVWRKQVGTDHNDVVAKGHKSISFDTNGNVVVLGTTRGNMYRQKSMDLTDYTSDMFLITFDKNDGTYPEFIRPIQSTTGVMVASTATMSMSSSTAAESSKWKPIQIFGITSLFIFLILALFLAAYTIGVHRTKQNYLKHQEDDTAEVQRYLEQLEQQEQQTKATVTSTLKHMFTKRSSSGVDALHLETNGGINDFPQEIRFDEEPVTNKSTFTVSDLGVTDDFMNAGSIASDHDTIESKQNNDANSSAYDELLQGLHSISGLNDVVDGELKNVNDLDDVASVEDYENGNRMLEPSAEVI